MQCCSGCFADQYLIGLVEGLSAVQGTCGLCGKDGLVAEVAELADYFEPLLGLYVADDGGVPIRNLLQNDWNLFAAGDDVNQSALLGEILNELQLTGELFKVGYEPSQDLAEQWATFSDELKNKNRFLPDSAPEREVFERFGQHLGEILTPNSAFLYRARINGDTGPYTLEDLKKPPVHRTTNGRANPVGIPYLYVASDPETAIAETRGHKADRVTVARYRITEPLDLFDLRSPRSTVSPFEQIDDIQFIHEHLPYFELLGAELSKPVVPRKANLEYLPSQYLCEVIKKNGHHGILYGSSVAEGFNCVIFADERLDGDQLQEYEVTDMRYVVSPLGEPRA